MPLALPLVLLISMFKNIAGQRSQAVAGYIIMGGSNHWDAPYLPPHMQCSQLHIICAFRPVVAHERFCRDLVLDKVQEAHILGTLSRSD